MVSRVVNKLFRQRLVRKTVSVFPPVKVGRELYQNAGEGEKSLWRVLPPYTDPKHYRFDAGTMVFEIKAETADEWEYLYLDPVKHPWTDYEWEFVITRSTTFREFAFNFRYVDFQARYRYRFEDDTIFFDKKFQSRWFNNIGSVPFPVEMGREYRVLIRTFGPNHQVFVDGDLKMSNHDEDIAAGPISVILWEDDGVTDCIATVRNIAVRELLPA